MFAWRLVSVSLALVLLGGCSLFTAKDEQAVKEIVSCEIFKTFADSMLNEPLYKSRFGLCSQVDDPDEEPLFTPSYYADAECTQPVDYKPTPFFEFCRNNLLNPYNHTYIGNAAAWPHEGEKRDGYSKSSKWTLSHGPSIDILALSPKGNHRPFMKQVEYHTVGDCHLEMRVYKKDILQQNLKPLMLIHGGAWRYRGFGAIGGEVLISQFTERGFVVFEPYYRLMGDADGPSECRIPAPVGNIAPGEMIVGDIEYALQWVNQYGSSFGVQTTSQVNLVGQSAGAHLAQWLAAHHGESVEKVLLFYTPADIKNYIEQLGHAYPWNHEGRSLIEQFVGVTDLATIQNNPGPFVVQNSFPELVRSGADHPPTFMIHGNADSLVPVEMSIRMCNALSGSDNHDLHEGGRYQCGRRRGVNNILHVIDGADHILDLNCAVDQSVIEVLGDRFNGLVKLCPSGSKKVTDKFVRPAMLEGIEWLL